MSPIVYPSWTIRLVLSVTIVFSFLGTRISTQPPAGSPQMGDRPTTAVHGEVLVGFRRALSDAELSVLHGQIDADRDQVLGTSGARRFHSRSLDENTLQAFFRAEPDVRFVEPNFVVQATALPNDPFFPQLWAMQNTTQPGADIGAVSAWDVSTGSAATVVAVVDTGVDYTHQDLAANMWSAPASFSVTIGGSKITCAAGTHGFNVLTMTCDPMDDNNHGSHVSGTIGATGNNGMGVVGVNWTTRLMGIKFLDSSGSGTTADAVLAIDFAIQAKQAFGGSNGANVRVLSNSWGGTSFSQALLDEVNLADTNDMLFVAAAGNSGSNNDTIAFYPADFTAPNVMAVAATDSTDHLASWSDYGATTVHLGAPGVGIVSTTIGNTYSNFSGTSMATPHVSGAAALVLSHCSLDTASVKHTLLTTVDLVPSLAGLTVSGGRLNVNTAIRNCTAVNVPPAPNGLSASPGTAQVSLAWAGSTGASTYNVKRGTASGAETLLASSVTATSYVDTNVANGVTYFYVVSAVNSAGESPNSNEVSATPVASPPPPPPPSAPPSAPAQLKAASGPGRRDISLTWTASSGATGYTVWRSVTSGGPYAAITNGLSGTTYTSTGLTSRKTYFFVVTAQNTAGTSGYSNQASATAK